MKKKTLVQSYIAGITDSLSGESYSRIAGYFLPELVTAFLLSSILSWIDASFIGYLESTSMCATQGVMTTFVHFLTKIAEGLAVGTVVLCGQYNGMERYRDVGKTAMSALVITLFVGGIISLLLYFGAYPINLFFKTSPFMVKLGVRFLRLRAIGIFFSFVYFALIGFLRGIKRPGLSMKFFLLGGVVFVFFDYALIFGKFGFPQMGFQGSAVASVIQYGVMLLSVMLFLVLDKKTRRYSASLLQSFDKNHAYDIISVSWPVMLDKATLAAAKIWLVRLIAPMGKTALASFTVIREMEQFAFVPAIAFAQVITFLVSNDYSVGNWLGIKNNTKKVIFLSSIMVFTILLLFSLWPVPVIQFFDKKGSFTQFTATAFPLLSVLVFFDLLQLILAGALRGAANVKTVMWTRVIVCICFFGPLSYGLSLLPITNLIVKFLLVYGSFYIGNGVMSLVYIYRFRRDTWKNELRIKASKVAHDQDILPGSSEPRQDITHRP